MASESYQMCLNLTCYFAFYRWRTSFLAINAVYAFFIINFLEIAYSGL